MSPSESGLDWTEWNTAAFARAQTERQPVLLSLVTRWSAACRDMDRRTFSDPAVISLATEEWVAIRVDADMRPDLADRYTLGGWPTTAFLTETGELIGGGTSVEPRRLEAAMRDLARVYRSRRDELLHATPGEPVEECVCASPREGPDLETVSDIAARALAALDEVREDRLGPPGRAFPMSVLRLVLRLSASGVAGVGMRDTIARALDAMVQGPLWDANSGGFYCESASREWIGVEPAKLLHFNAHLLVTYAEAAVVMRQARFAEVARAIADYLERVLRDERESAYHPSEYCGPSDSSAARSRASRAPIGPPRDAGAGAGPDHAPDDATASRSSLVDPLFYVDGNARLASAYLQAGSWLDEPRLTESAVAAIERVIPAAYQRAAGLAHCLDPRPRTTGLLGDQIASCGALLDAADVTGRVAYADLAEELMRSAIRKLWDDARSALSDRVRTRAGAGDVGRLGRPRFPFALNCEAAQVMARLAALTGDVDLGGRARRILAGFEPEGTTLGTTAAAWGLAALEVAGSPAASRPP